MADAELYLPPDVQYVGLARLVVCAAARLAGMSDERVEDLRIAVSEATTNAVAAHRRDGSRHPVGLHFGVTDDHTFAVTISDHGPGFEPSSPPPPPGQDWPTEGGFGLTVIKQLADDVRFNRTEGMRVAMHFSLAEAAVDGTAPQP